MGTRFALALHGGAGARRGVDYGREVEHMRGVVETTRDRLAAGASAVDVAVETVRALEDSGLYVAGRGASPNSAGVYELDASLMDGRSGKAGGVAALVGVRSPIEAARAVMDKSRHVLLAGEGAAAFARDQGLETIGDPEAWFTKAARTPEDEAAEEGELAHGTVGCVVLDGEGRLAAATSTGGVFGKRPGRVGDTPIVGAGTWADRQVAVSCTGLGEYFLRTATAAEVAFRVRLTGEPLSAAAEAALASVKAGGGDGGLIAVDAEGRIAMPFNSEGMKRAALHPDGRIEAGAF